MLLVADERQLAVVPRVPQGVGRGDPGDPVADDDDPVLLRADGSAVDTWRQGYPYAERMDRQDYEREKRLLQIEMLKLQYWAKRNGQRLVVVFEGRDAAGKGGTISALTRRVSARVFRVVALPSPTEREKTQMYLQRYLPHLPAAGEVVIFDRSWYNRAGVERVLGFCTPEETDHFLEMVPGVEQAIVAYLAQHDAAATSVRQLQPFVQGDISAYRIVRGRAAGPGC